MDGFLGGTLASQIDILDQIWCLGCCNCGKHHFFPITQHPWASSGRSLPSNPSWEDAHLWETFFSSQSCGFPCLPSIIPGRMPDRGKYFLWLFSLPDTCLRPLPYLFPLCMHYLQPIYLICKMCGPKEMQIKIQKNMIG